MLFLRPQKPSSLTPDALEAQPPDPSSRGDPPSPATSPGSKKRERMVFCWTGDRFLGGFCSLLFGFCSASSGGL